MELLQQKNGNEDIAKLVKKAAATLETAQTNQGKITLKTERLIAEENEKAQNALRSEINLLKSQNLALM